MTPERFAKGMAFDDYVKVTGSPKNMRADLLRSPGTLGKYFSSLLLFLGLVAFAYFAVLVFSSLLHPYRFPIPYAVPIFDIPFALTAIGVGYLCLERHRLRQDVRSASMGVMLWLAALLALAHILTQPDYPETPGVNPGVAPYFFLLSYLMGFFSVGLATYYGDRHLRLTDRQRFLVAVGLVLLSIVIVIAVLEIRPFLPSLVVKDGKFSLFGCVAGGLANGLVGVWALWGARTRFRERGQDWFAGFLLLAAFIWIVGLIGFLLLPFRYSVTWYVAGLARPLGVGAIFVGLLREQVWLYRESRARQRDLQSLHAAGQALVMTLDPQRIVETSVTKAVGVAGAQAAILFRLDGQTRVLRALGRAGRISQELVSDLELPIGQGASGLAVAEGRPVWTSNLGGDARFPLSPEVSDRMRREHLRAVLSIPLLIESREVFGALSVVYTEERGFSATEVELLEAYGTQVAVALENARAFDQLALKARTEAALRDFSQRLLEASGEETILDEATRITREVLQADYSALFLYDPNEGGLDLRAGVGWEPGTAGRGAASLPDGSLASTAFVQRESVEVEDLSAECRFSIPAYLAAHRVRAGLLVPLGVHDQPVGVVGAYYRAPHRFSEEERRFLLSLGQQTALALEKVRLYTELQANLRRLQETQAQLIQADKLTALGTMLSGMAHELNGPLTSILLSIQLLQQQQTVLPHPMLERLNHAERECRRAAQLIKDLLLFARRRAPERRLVDLNAVVKAALSLQAPQFSLQNIRLVTNLDPNLPKIWADSHQLQQVFLNLFTNATHAVKSARGQGTLAVRSFQKGSEVCVTVEDDGPGIPREHLGRIFDPFFTTKTVGEGSGLGLSLSLGIVEGHEGRITAENVAGGGARFTIDLPIGEGEEPAETPVPTIHKARRGAQILVVEDEVSVRGILNDVLAFLGHQVESAETGREAMAKLERKVYDLVTLDFRLPDMSASEVWRWLLTRHPDQLARVVFMTGDLVSADTQEFLRQTGRPVITKPPTMERICQVLDEVLEAKLSDS